MPAGPSPPARTLATHDQAPAVAAGLVALVAFVVYALTLERSLPTGDSGELIASAYVLGVAHPPGYPLYMLLGHAATWVPVGSVALRMNLLSALLDAAAVALVFLTILRLTGPGREGDRALARYAAAATGALLLAFSSLFWAYSVVAEVFALDNVFAALLLMIGLEWSRRPERTRLLWAFMLLLGLALCNQQTIALLVPGFAVLGVVGWRRLPAGSLRPRDLGIAVGAFAFGLLPYLYLPIAASGDPPMNWDDPTTLGRWWTDVSRGNYGSTSLTVAGSHGSVGKNLSLLFGDLAHGFVFAGIVLAVLGLQWAWSNRRAEGVALLVAFAVAGPAFVALTRTAFPGKLTEGIVARFYILPGIPLAIAAGLGAWWAVGKAESLGGPRLAGAAAAALLIVPTAAAVVHYAAENQRGNEVALGYARDLLAPLRPGALLLMRGDENLTSVAYAQNVLHERPDVIALDTELLKLPAYVAEARRAHPALAIPFEAYDGGIHTSLNTLVQANIGQRPVYVVGVQVEKGFGRPFDQVAEGLSRRLVPAGDAPDPFAYLARHPSIVEGLHFPSRLYPASSWERTIGGLYADAAFDLGVALQRDGATGDAPVVEEAYRTAIRLQPALAKAYEYLGVALQDDNGDPKEVAEVWETYLRLAPDDPDASKIGKALAALLAPARRK